MTIFHFSAVLIDQDENQARYTMFLDFDGRKGWTGTATVNKNDGIFSMESRDYEVTPKISKLEHHCVKAIQHKFNKLRQSEGVIPKEIFYIA